MCEAAALCKKLRMISIGTTHLIFLFFQSYFLPVLDCSRAAISFNIVELLLALSQVTWPTFAPNVIRGD
jgi:hypothetical protein